MIYRHLIFPLILIVSGLITTNSGVFGQLTSNRDGKLDRQFGIGGLTLLEPGLIQGYSGGAEMCQTPDGKILVVYQHSATPPTSSFVISRILDNGQPDVSFGKNGTLLVDDWPSFSPNQIRVQPDGKILLGGVERQSVDFMVVRLTGDGQTDSTFGINGVFTRDFSLPGGLSNDRSYSIELQADGKIIVAGITDRITSSNRTTTLVSLVRLNSTGTIDESFGNGGVSVTIGNGTSTSYTLGMVLETELLKDGKILVATKQKRLVSTAPDNFRFYTNILKFLGDGSLDPKFSDDGILDFDDGDETEITGLDVFPSGKILLSSVFTLKRFNDNGSPDSTFVFNNQSYGFIQILTVATTSNGKILNGGIKAIGPNIYAVIRRFYADGTPDFKFGVGGENLLRVTDVDSAMTRVAVTASGRLLALGERRSPTTGNVFIARLFLTRKL